MYISDMHYQLLSYGLFSEYLPENFSTEDLAINYGVLKNNIKNNSFKNHSKPTCFTIHKTDLVRRLIKIPNASHFFLLVECINNNWNEIENVLTSKNSLSSITTELNATKFFNIPSWRDMKNLQSDYKHNKRRIIQEAIGSCYSLKLDILNCYGSIYTHSIEWAVTSKAASKIKNRLVNYGQDLDLYVRRMQSNETYGIPIGPFTSRIISEMILCKIDEGLVKKGYKFCRYVDDYSFFFSSEQDLHEAKATIAKVLREYNFTINDSKIVINKYPYDRDIVDIKKELKDFSKIDKKERFTQLIEKSNTLHLLGSKGIYKYMLKIIRKEQIDKNEWNVVQAHLLSIMMIEPKLAQYIAELFLKNKSSISNIHSIESVINKMLSSNLNVGNEHEVLWILWLALKLELKCGEQDIIEILESEYDLPIIIAFNLLKKQQMKSGKINDAISNLIDKLKTYDMNSERWLLLYTIIVNEYSSDSSIIDIINENEFFRICLKKGIKFYKNI